MYKGVYTIIQDVKSISSYSNAWFDEGQEGKFLSIQDNGHYIILLFRDTDCTDVEQMNNWVMSLSGNEAYYRLSNPELITTNIREELKLPTFINNTYVSVNGGIQGSIKAKAPVDGGKMIGVLESKNKELETINNIQDELIDLTMLATDEMYMMLEPLLAEALSERSVSKMVDMYVAMVQRGIKTIDQVPVRYREQVKKILDQLEK